LEENEEGRLNCDRLIKIPTFELNMAIGGNKKMILLFARI